MNKESVIDKIAQEVENAFSHLDKGTRQSDVDRIYKSTYNPVTKAEYFFKITAEHLFNNNQDIIDLLVLETEYELIQLGYNYTRGCSSFDRYVFPDGSAIVKSKGGNWGIGVHSDWINHLRVSCYNFPDNMEQRSSLLRPIPNNEYSSIPL